MIVKGKEYKIEDLLKTIDTSFNSFKKVGNLMLTKNEIDVLERNHIEYKSSSSLRDLITKINFYLEDEENDPDIENEIDYILKSISERAYYEEYKK